METYVYNQAIRNLEKVSMITGQLPSRVTNGILWGHLTWLFKDLTAICIPCLLLPSTHLGLTE